MMDYAARVGDPIQHSYVQVGGELGALAGFGIGAAVAVGAGEAAMAGAALVLGTVLTGGLLAFAIGAVVVAGAIVTTNKFMKAGKTIGEAVGKTQTNPHAGDITEGAPTVFTGPGMPNQARITDKVSCHPGKRIASGSETVWVEKHRATRKGEKTECAGFIRDGEHTVLIGGASVTELPITGETSDQYNNFFKNTDTIATVAGFVTVDPTSLATSAAGVVADQAAASSNPTVAALGKDAQVGLSLYGASKQTSGLGLGASMVNMSGKF